MWATREGHQARKNSNMRNKKEREVNARIVIKLWENTDSSKDTRDMRFHERSFKLRRMSQNFDSSKEKFNQIEEDEEKKREDTFNNNNKSVFSQVKKNESVLERIRGYQGEMQIHLCQIERNEKCSWVKANKIPKKKKNWLGWKQEREV